MKSTGVLSDERKSFLLGGGAPFYRCYQTAHVTARAIMITSNGVEQAAPAPRFSRTPAVSVGLPPAATRSLDGLGW